MEKSIGCIKSGFSNLDCGSLRYIVAPNVKSLLIPNAHPPALHPQIYGHNPLVSFKLHSHMMTTTYLKKISNTNVLCLSHHISNKQSDQRRHNDFDRWKRSSHVLFIVVQMTGFVPNFWFTEQMLHVPMWDESSLDQLGAYSLLMFSLG